ncbi:MAG: DUF456 family protein [Caldilineaceae bacterium]|nr:DUF456 family protein [Caldilineaceae bacterium]
MTITTLSTAIGFILISLGLIGIIVPLLPGLPLLWLGAFAWAWGNDFQQVGWPTLVALALLVGLGIVVDLFLASAVSIRAGVSWRAIGGAILGGLLGGIFLTWIPLLGTLAGALIGAVAGMWVVEFRIRNDVDAATNAVWSYLTGVAFASLINLFLALLMLALFFWQAYWA